VALKYGFNLWKYSENDEFWQKKYEKLNEREKDFYHRILPLLMYVVEINHLSKATIPVIVMRYKLVPILSEKDSKRVITEEYLERFIGFETNVKTVTDKEFFQKIERTNLQKSTIKSRSQIEQEFFNYLKEVHDKGKIATASACKEK